MKKVIKKKKDLQVKASDIFTFDAKLGRLFLEGRQLEDKEIRGLQEEVRYLEKTAIYGIWMNTVKDQAKQKMFEKAESFEDMKWGKAMLKDLELIEQINKVIKAWQPRVSPQTILSKQNQPIQH